MLSKKGSPRGSRESRIRVALLIPPNSRSLLKAAEEVHLPKYLRQEFGGGLKEFVGSEANCFEGSDDEVRFFTTQERQSLVLHLLHTMRAGPHDLHSLPGFKMVEGQAIIPKCISAGIISQVRVLLEFSFSTEVKEKMTPLRLRSSPFMNYPR